MKRIIENGYAGNQTEVIKQAILSYERMIEEEELSLGDTMELIFSDSGMLELLKLPEDMRAIFLMHLEKMHTRLPLESI